MELCNYAAKAPDVYLAVVREPEYDFWGSIIPALNIRIYGFIFEAAGAEVDDLDA
jgi:hypothetical protein